MRKSFSVVLRLQLKAQLFSRKMEFWGRVQQLVAMGVAIQWNLDPNVQQNDTFSGQEPMIFVVLSTSLKSSIEKFLPPSWAKGILQPAPHRVSHSPRERFLQRRMQSMTVKTSSGLGSTEGVSLPPTVLLFPPHFRSFCPRDHTMHLLNGTLATLSPQTFHSISFDESCNSYPVLLCAAIGGLRRTARFRHNQECASYDFHVYLTRQEENSSLLQQGRRNIDKNTNSRDAALSIPVQ